MIGNTAEEARSVRLSFADGTTAEDAVDDAIVLFYVTPGVDFPAEVVILGDQGAVLAAYDEFDTFV